MSEAERLAILERVMDLPGFPKSSGIPLIAADPGKVEELIREGVALRRAGKDQAALPLFQKAHAKMQHDWDTFVDQTHGE